MVEKSNKKQQNTSDKTLTRVLCRNTDFEQQWEKGKHGSLDLVLSGFRMFHEHGEIGFRLSRSDGRIWLSCFTTKFGTSPGARR